MKARLFWPALVWLVSLLALPLAAQVDPNSYQGPGVLSPGGSDIGQRSGQQVDLRFWGGVNGVYDTNVQPFVTDAHGNLIRVPNLLGLEASFGAYGSHRWEHAVLSLNYSGTYKYYPNNQVYDGTNQALALDYAVQYSSRLAFDLRLSGATLQQATGSVADTATANGSVPSTQLFDSRASYVDVTGSMTYIQSPRMSYTVGGGGDANYFDANGLTSSNGYHVNASANYRTSLTTSVGAIYTYSTQDASGGSFDSRTQTVAGQYSTTWAHVWTFNLTAGAAYVQVHQLIAVPLNPLLAALFGVPAVVLPYDTHNFYPTGSATLKRQFQRADRRCPTRAVSQEATGSSSAHAMRASPPASAIPAFTSGTSKIQGRYQKSTNLGQDAGLSSTYGGGTGVTYEVARYTHLSARFDIGHYDLGVGSSYNRTTERATLGVVFSPGNIPLSLW